MQRTHQKHFSRIQQADDTRSIKYLFNWLNKPILRGLSIKPATLAVIVQIVALIGVLGLARLIPVVVSMTSSFTTLQLVLMQACLATIFAQLFGMASWWLGIHFCLPLAMYLMSNFAIPEEVYLGCFMFTLALFWTTFRSQVPFFPSFPAVWKQVANMLPDTHSVRLIDIGSGLGDMSMYIATVRPDSHIEGIEIAPLLGH